MSAEYTGSDSVSPPHVSSVSRQHTLSLSPATLLPIFSVKWQARSPAGSPGTPPRSFCFGNLGRVSPSLSQPFPDGSAEFQPRLSFPRVDAGAPSFVREHPSTFACAGGKRAGRENNGRKEKETRCRVRRGIASVTVHIILATSDTCFLPRKQN